MGYKSRPHLPRGAEGAARQASLKEAAVAKKKKRAEKAQRRHEKEKEKEIGRQVRAGESQSVMEAELESEEPTEMGGDASTSKDDGARGIVATLVERHAPAATLVSDGWDTERRGDVPMSRKHAASSDAAVRRHHRLCPPCSKRGGACRPVGGACSYPRIFGVGACV